MFQVKFEKYLSKIFILNNAHFIANLSNVDFKNILNTQQWLQYFGWEFVSEFTLCTFETSFYDYSWCRYKTVTYQLL